MYNIGLVAVGPAVVVVVVVIVVFRRNTGIISGFHRRRRSMRVGFGIRLEPCPLSDAETTAATALTCNVSLAIDSLHAATSTFAVFGVVIDISVDVGVGVGVVGHHVLDGLETALRGRHAQRNAGGARSTGSVADISK